MFASHFARIQANHGKKKAPQDAVNSSIERTKKQNQKEEQSQRDTKVNLRRKKRGRTNNSVNDNAEQNIGRKRRRNERVPRKPRPTAEALDLSKQLQELSRQKRLADVLDLFWQKQYEKLRDNHHACIVVDCCSKCGAVDAAEKIVASLPKPSVSVETKTALLKCYAHSGEMFKAMHLFRQMCKSQNEQQKPNVRTLNTLLRGCLWTASTDRTVNGQTQTAGGVVSSEEAWLLYQSMQKEEGDQVDTSSYEVSIILLCQALRVDEAQARIEQLQSQYEIKCKGKAAIKGGDQSSLESCGISYLSLARAWALLGCTDDMWTACQRCLHAIQASRAMLEKEVTSTAITNEPRKKLDRGGKRGWKVDASEEGQKRAASNLAYRKHRLTEAENEAKSLLKRRNSAEELSMATLAERLFSKLLYFAGGAITGVSATSCSALPVSSSAVWHSFGLGGLAEKEIILSKGDMDRKLSLTKEGFVDLSAIFPGKQKDSPIDVELGSGFGDWIVRQALAFPDRSHFAVELRSDRVYQIFSRASLTGAKPLDNLCTVGADSGTFLRDRLRNGCVASVFANHPEPPTQTFGQNAYNLEGIMAGDEAEPVHMLNSTTLGWAADALRQGGRIVIVTDNRNFANLICATFVRLMRQKTGLLRCLDSTASKKLKLKPIETFPEDVYLYEGLPTLQIGHARDEMLAGQSYFDRLWKTGAGSHSDATRRYLVVMYKR